MKRLTFAVLLALIIFSCAKNPFSTRDSDPPTEQAGTFIPPTSPQIALENLRFSYAEFVISNFTQTLDSEFVFIFDFIQSVPADSGWGFQQEVNLTDNLFNDFNANKGRKSLSLRFEPVLDQPDLIGDTSAVLVRIYTITVSDSLGQLSESYSGVSRFDLAESSFQFWTIRRWEDFHDAINTTSWADFKNAYR
jgi:hypothetical protein